MRVFHYQAVATTGRVVDGEIAAEDHAEIYATLHERGLDLLEARERRPSRFVFGRGKSTQEEVIEFTRSLASLITAGIPLLHVLDDLAEQAERKAWRRVIEDVRARVEGGSSISGALDAHRDAFGGVYIALVRAGEESGKLDHTLSRLAGFMEWNKQVKSDIRRALSYPGIVGLAMIGFLCVIIFFVLPRLAGLIDTLDVDLPAGMRVIVSGGEWLQRFWYLALLVPIGLGAGFWHMRRVERGRELIDRTMLRLPLIGPIIRMASYSRFANGLGTLLEAGVPIDRSLRLIGDGVGNVVISRGVAETQRRIEAGESLSDALERCGQFSRQVVRMVRVGEARGDLPQMLDRLTSHYDRELPYLVRRLVSAVGPITVFVLAGTVGASAVSMFNLLLRINDAVK